MKATLHTATYACCPNCGNNEAFLLHDQIVTNGHFHEWSCTDCHHVYDGKLVGADWELTHKGVDTPTYVLLQIPPQPKPVYFVVPSVKTHRSDPVGSAETNENNRFLYEENSSLTNHIQCAAIIGWDAQFGQYDYSPTGLAKYVAEVPSEGLFDPSSADEGKIVQAFAPHNDDMRQLAQDLNLLGD